MRNPRFDVRLAPVLAFGWEEQAERAVSSGHYADRQEYLSAALRRALEQERRLLDELLSQSPSPMQQTAGAA